MSAKREEAGKYNIKKLRASGALRARRPRASKELSLHHQTALIICTDLP
jgi:hypothetical protein